MPVDRYNPIKTTKTSFMGTMNMLGLAKRTKVTSSLRRCAVWRSCVVGAAASPICRISTAPCSTVCFAALSSCQRHLLLTAVAGHVQARFLLTSTSEVYGDPLVHPQPETYFGNVNPIGERSCYDEGKRVAETLTFDYYREHGLEVSVGVGREVLLPSNVMITPLDSEEGLRGGGSFLFPHRSMTTVRTQWEGAQIVIR